MPGHGASRRRFAHLLKVAYVDGLLSEETFTDRVDQLLRPKLVEPGRLIGDLSFRGAAGWRRRLRNLPRHPRRRSTERLTLLALDRLGGRREVIVGRHHSCDVILSDPSVSRRHARLVFRDGNWVLQDLNSTNGTTVNGEFVGRCIVGPGDLLALGDQRLLID